MNVSRARPIMELLTETIPPSEQIHDWLPAGFTLLAAAPKAGKSTFAEQIARQVSLEHPVLYLALEYNTPLAQKRFDGFGPNNQVYVMLEGDIGRLDVKGAAQLERAIDEVQPKLIVVDVLACLKQKTSGSYEDEYEALQALKKLGSYAGADVLVLHHTRKPGMGEEQDPFDSILGSRALMGVPDNLIVMEQKGLISHVHYKGRLIERRRLHFKFENGDYVETDSTGVDSGGIGRTQGQILSMLSEGSMTVTELAFRLQRSPSQISRACEALVKRNEIMRQQPRGPYELCRPVS